MTRNSRSLLPFAAALTAAVTLALAAAPAVARPPLGAGDVALKYRELDLGSDAGRAGLYRRLQAAAEQVCVRYDGLDLERRRVHAHCVAEVLANAVGQVHDAGLQALYDASHPAPASATPPVVRTARR